ncbi:MAG: acyltransferase family protein [Clostridiaceae bacterium]|nr:acyltransferase family protein [Clostridiaceae bacterium]
MPTEIKGTSVRNYGIDLLKILSMQMIVFLHILGAGGILANLEVLTFKYELMWLLEIAFFCAVNCFALATGYVMVNIRFKYNRIISLWLHVIYYTLGITLIFWLFVPGTVGLKQWLWGLFPVTYLQYWYFTAYFAMFFFIPFFNKLIDAIDKKMLQKLIVTAVMIFSVMTIVARNDIFRIHDGYSMIWLSTLYFIGAYFKRYPMKRRLSFWASMAGYGFMVLLTWLSKFAVQYLGQRLLGGERVGGMLVNYVSPTMLAAAVFLLLAFAQLEFKSSIAKKLIIFFAPMSFSVYLIHCHPLIWCYVLTDRLIGLTSLSAPVLFASVIGIGALVYIACSLVDTIRIFLFEKLKINKFCIWLSNQISFLAKRISESLDGIF